MRTVDVIVVGAGPTGLMLAIELAGAGVEVAVLERQAEPSGQSRGGGVNPRTAEVLAMRGLLARVLERALPRDAPGGHFAGLPVALDARPWRTRYPDGLLIPQDRLEQVLEARLGELGTEVTRSTALTALTPDADGVLAVAAGPGGEQRLRAAYLVACDGGHSTVRALTGVPFPGRAGTMSAVSADVELAVAADSVPRRATHISTLTRVAGGYWMLAHPLDGSGGAEAGFRVVFGPLDSSSAPERSAPVTPEEVAAALAAVHPGTVLGRLRWGTRFSDASRQLTDYRHGRVLFAGDAAHTHPPVGGQGLNLGVQDAMNLGWKLAATVRGDAPDGLLDSYHAERHPVAAGVLACTAAQGVLMTPAPRPEGVSALRDIVTELARLPAANRYLAGLMSGLALRYDLGSTEPLVGRRMLDLSLRTPAGDRTVSQLLEPGRGLLLELGARPEPTPLPDRLRQVSATVLDSPVGRDPAAAGDAEPLGTPPVQRILVRPDGYVGWLDRGAGAPVEPALARWFGPVPAARPA